MGKCILEHIYSDCYGCRGYEEQFSFFIENIWIKDLTYNDLYSSFQIVLLFWQCFLCISLASSVR